jgi:hypothetical protein
VWVSLFEKPSDCSDNFFDMLPHSKKTITMKVTEDLSLEQIKALLRIKTLDKSY